VYTVSCHDARIYLHTMRSTWNAYLAWRHTWRLVYSIFILLHYSQLSYAINIRFLRYMITIALKSRKKKKWPSTKEHLNLKMRQYFDSSYGRRLIATENNWLGFGLDDPYKIRILFRGYQCNVRCNIRFGAVTRRLTLSRCTRCHDTSRVRSVSGRWRWCRLQSIQQ